MQLLNIKKNNNMTEFYYRLTSRIGWEELVSMIDTIITSDFSREKGKIYNIEVGKMAGPKGNDKTKELQDANYKIRECDFAKQENSWISISGYSSIMETNMKYTLWNQLNRCLIEIENEPYIEKEGERVYDKYVDSIEIQGFVNCALNRYKKVNMNKESKTSNDTDVNKKITEMDIECFVCHNKFQIKLNIPENEKTFYCKCPNCNTEIKRGNPNYKDN